MNNIEEKEYEYTKRVILKDGSVREYICKKSYTPADKLNKITQKKVIDKIKLANKEQLTLIYKYITDEIHI